MFDPNSLRDDDGYLVVEASVVINLVIWAPKPLA